MDHTYKQPPIMIDPRATNMAAQADRMISSCGIGGCNVSSSLTQGMSTGNMTNLQNIPNQLMGAASDLTGGELAFSGTPTCSQGGGSCGAGEAEKGGMGTTERIFQILGLIIAILAIIQIFMALRKSLRRKHERPAEEEEPERSVPEPVAKKLRPGLVAEQSTTVQAEQNLANTDLLRARPQRSIPDTGPTTSTTALPAAQQSSTQTTVTASDPHSLAIAPDKLFSPWAVETLANNGVSVHIN